MKKLAIFTLLFVGFSLSLQAQSLISSSGGVFTGENIIVNFTAGDAFTGTLTGSNITLSGGFVGANLIIPTSNEIVDVDVPIDFNLSQNYPNPFNPSTNIQYSLPETSQLKLEVFNSIGMLVATLVDEQKQAGYHTVRFDASSYSSGMYFYRLIANGNVITTKKMILIK